MYVHLHQLQEFCIIDRRICCEKERERERERENNTSPVQ